MDMYRYKETQTTGNDSILIIVFLLQNLMKKTRIMTWLQQICATVLATS